MKRRTGRGRDEGDDDNDDNWSQPRVFSCVKLVLGWGFLVGPTDLSRLPEMGDKYIKSIVIIS